jgi:hypothetical protein
MFLVFRKLVEKWSWWIKIIYELSKLEFHPASNIPQLLSTTEIGTWKVKCHLPLNHKVSTGLLGPLGDETSDDLTNKAASGWIP